MGVLFIKNSGISWLITLTFNLWIPGNNWFFQQPWQLQGVILTEKALTKLYIIPPTIFSDETFASTQTYISIAKIQLWELFVFKYEFYSSLYCLKLVCVVEHIEIQTNRQTHSYSSRVLEIWSLFIIYLNNVYHGKYGPVFSCMVSFFYAWWSSIDHPGCFSIVQTNLEQFIRPSLMLWRAGILS